MVATTDDVRVALVEETTAGTTPATPTFLELPITGEGLTVTENARPSSELGGEERGPRDIVVASREVEGQISVPLKFSSVVDLLIEGALGAAFGDDPRSLGTGADEAYVAKTQKYFTIEKRWQIDNTPTYRYHRFTGCQVNSMSFSFGPEDEVIVTFEFIGQAGSDNAAEVSGATYTAPPTTSQMTVPNVTFSVVDTSGPTTLVDVPSVHIVTQLNVSLPNNVRGIRSVGVLGNAATRLGRMDPSLTASVYYEDSGVLGAFENSTELKATVVLADSAGNSYTIEFPRCRFGSAPYPVAGGQDQDAIIEAQLLPLVGTGAGETYVAKVTRSAA